MLEKRRLMTPGPPQLQCSVPADNSWEAPPRRRVYRYADGQLGSYRSYFIDTGRLSSSSCVFVDDAQLRTDRVVMWPPEQARKAPSGRGGRGGTKHDTGMARGRPKRAGRGGPRGRRRGATKMAGEGNL